jgi:hypothetical protein
MPLTVALWDALGWNSAPIIVAPKGGQRDPLYSLVNEYAPRQVFIFLNPIEGYKTATVAQVSRLYLPTVLHKNTWIMTSDVDMWPLSKRFFEPENHAFHMFYGDFYEFKKFPMCYLAGYGIDWRRIMGYDTRSSLQEQVKAVLDEELPRDAADNSVWFFDEELFARRWMEVKSQVAHWSVIRNGYPPPDRLDRSQWPQGKLDLTGKVDAHLPRPGWEEPVWGQLKQILGEAAPSTQDWADEYRVKWLNCLENKAKASLKAFPAQEGGV